MWAAPLWLVVVASYLAVAFAFLFPHDFRNSAPLHAWLAWTAFMIRTFLFHLGLLLCVIAVVAGLAGRWWLLAAAALLALPTAGPCLADYLPKRTPAVAGETLTVMSANLLAFNHRTNGLVQEILAAEPDVLLLQEYTPRWHEALGPALGPGYPYVRHACRSDCFGLAIYSRRPFVGSVDLTLPLGDTGSPQARAVIELDGQAVAFYNVHLVPPMGGRRATIQRREFADLLDLLRREQLPLVLCGDFNFPNASVFGDELKRLGLVDAHDTSGRGLGSSWPARGLRSFLPGVRIDHIFLSANLTSTRSDTLPGHGSDHRPIVADIGFKR